MISCYFETFFLIRCFLYFSLLYRNQNIEKEEEPIDLDSLTPEQMKEMLKKMMGQQ